MGKGTGAEAIGMRRWLPHCLWRKQNKELEHLRAEVVRLTVEVARLNVENAALLECSVTKDKLKADLRSAREDVEACLSFLRTELQWADFREEFFGDDVSGQNARKLLAFLKHYEKS